MSPFAWVNTDVTERLHLNFVFKQKSKEYEMCPGEKTEVEKKQSFGSSSIILNKLVWQHLLMSHRLNSNK